MNTESKPVEEGVQDPPVGNRRRPSRILMVPHCIAAILLLAVAAVHYVAVIEGIELLKLYNTAFPFFKNREMFVMAIGIDVSVALLCIYFRGRQTADLAIMAFVLLMLWYRLAVHMTNPEGYSCGCMGILTVIFNLTPYQETVAAYVTLLLLAFCAIPGIKCFLQTSLRRPSL